MPELSLQSWILIGGAGLIVVGLIIAFASRSGREQTEKEQRIRRSQTLRVLGVVVLLVIMVAFAFANAETVSVDWVLTQTEAPMVLVIALSGGIGFLIGALVTSRRSD